jgi:hypothetical protein
MKIYKRKGNEFSMMPYLKVLAEGEHTFFVRILTPKCWNLNAQESVMKKEDLEKKYLKVDSYDSNFYTE